MWAHQPLALFAMMLLTDSCSLDQMACNDISIESQNKTQAMSICLWADFQRMAESHSSGSLLGSQSMLLAEPL